MRKLYSSTGFYSIIGNDSCMFFWEKTARECSYHSQVKIYWYSAFHDGHFQTSFTENLDISVYNMPFCHISKSEKIRLHCEKGPAEVVLPYQLRKFNLPQELLKQFYSAIIESVLCTTITVWFSSATKSDLRRLRRVVRTGERIIGTTLPTLQELYLSRVSKRAGKITLDPSHPAHSLFELLPSGRRYRALSTRTTRHRNSFFPQAIHLMNTWH